MYVYYLHGKFQRGEKLTPEEEKILVDAFRMREYMLKDEEREYLTFGQKIACIGVFCVLMGLGIKGTEYLSKKLGEYSVKVPIYLQQQEKTPEGVLIRDMLDWGEREKRLQNQFNYGSISLEKYTNQYNILEKERTHLKERLEKR
jgi:hypothetical protein